MWPKNKCVCCLLSSYRNCAIQIFSPHELINWGTHNKHMKKSWEQIPQSKFQLPAVTFHTPSLTSSALLCTQSGNHLDLSHFPLLSSLSHSLTCCLLHPCSLSVSCFLHLIFSPLPPAPALHFVLSSLSSRRLGTARASVRPVWDTGRTPRQQPVRQRKWNILQMGWDDSACFQSGITCFRDITVASAAGWITSLLERK